MPTSKRPRSPRRAAISLLMARPREIGAADFKARCLEIMDEVERFGTEVVITKHRKPVARLVPVRNEEAAFCGSLEGMVLKEGDVTSPVGIPWESDEPNLA